MKDKMKETLTIKPVHDNSERFTITRLIVEEVDLNTLNKILVECEQALKAAQEQLDDLPKQVAERERHFRTEITTLNERIKQFTQYATKLTEKEQATVINSQRGGP